MKTMVLAEKPSVGREIARVLGCFRREHGYSEGSRYVVTWALGHLVELAQPAEYNPAYKRWSLASLPMLPSEMKLQVIPQTKEQFALVSSLMQRDDVNELVIATDAGREGELVARWIMEKAAWSGPVKRLWISSQTDSAITEGFENLRDGEAYVNLFRAAESRAEADWIVGMNVTRALTCKHDTSLSAGRVQTPTLAILVDREDEVDAFSGKYYWTLRADFDGIRGGWRDGEGSARIPEEEQAQSIDQEITGKQGRVVSLERNEKIDTPPLAYDLTELQRDGNVRLEFSAKKTLDVLQVLYERHKIVTYPRTDSRYISSDIVATLPARIMALMGTPYAEASKEVLKLNKPLDSRFVNDRKVTDHHAIIPTEQRVNMEKLSKDERSLYDLIVKRFLEVLSPDCIYDSVKLTIEAAGHRFEAKSIEMKQIGWKQLAGADDLDDEDNSSGLSGIKEGDLLLVRNTEIKRELTRAPSRYTEATLLSAMEHAGRFIDDSSLKRSIAGSGIGTSATRADIIEKLLGKYYIEREGRYLKPTAKGRELVKMVPGELRSPELTARWEKRLAAISDGSESFRAFSEDIRRRTVELVDEIKTSKISFQPDYKDAKSCPACGGQMIEVTGKEGKKAVACQSLSCGYEEVDGKVTRQGRPKPQGRKDFGEDGSKADTATFADLIKASQERKQRKRKK